MIMVEDYPQPTLVKIILVFGKIYLPNAYYGSKKLTKQKMACKKHPARLVQDMMPVSRIEESFSAFQQHNCINNTLREILDLFFQYNQLIIMRTMVALKDDCNKKNTTNPATLGLLSISCWHQT